MFQMYQDSYPRGLFVICKFNQQFYKKGKYLFYYPSLNVAPSVKFVVNKKLVVPENGRLVGLSLQIVNYNFAGLFVTLRWMKNRKRFWHNIAANRNNIQESQQTKVGAFQKGFPMQ